MKNRPGPDSNPGLWLKLPTFYQLSYAGQTRRTQLTRTTVYQWHLVCYLKQHIIITGKGTPIKVEYVIPLHHFNIIILIGDEIIRVLFFNLKKYSIIVIIYF